MKGDKRRWLRGAIIGLGAGIVAVAATSIPLFEHSENRSFDLRARFFADPKRADPNIVAVFVDQKSLDAFQKAMPPVNGRRIRFQFQNNQSDPTQSAAAAKGNRYCQLAASMAANKRLIYRSKSGLA